MYPEKDSKDKLSVYIMTYGSNDVVNLCLNFVGYQNSETRLRYKLYCFYIIFVPVISFDCVFLIFLQTMFRLSQIYCKKINQTKDRWTLEKDNDQIKKITLLFSAQIMYLPLNNIWLSTCWAANIAPTQEFMTNNEWIAIRNEQFSIE